MQQVADCSKSSACPSTLISLSKIALTRAFLPDLSDQDLEDLGVLLGDHRKLLRAVRDLSNASANVTARSAPVATEATRQAEAERRQLT
jgi:hypothetical protein